MVLRRDPDKAAAKAEQRAERQREWETQQAEKDRQQAWAAWWASPPGQARAARDNGQKVFQVAIPLIQTERSIWGTLSGDPAAKRQRSADPIGPIEEIEAQGIWCLALR